MQSANSQLFVARERAAIMEETTCAGNDLATQFLDFCTELLTYREQPPQTALQPTINTCFSW